MDNVTALVTQPAKPLARALDFTPEQRKMIRDTFANGASDAEFAVLMEVAKARNLNPLLRQIHFVKRWDRAKGCEVWSTQIAIDGLRAVAERTGIYAGQDEPEFEEAGGKLVCCKVRVYRKDWQRPAVGVAHFAEYAQRKKDGSLTQFWNDKPHIMLAKCAEALAIRKAFPEDTSGLYVAEEMGQEPEAVAATHAAEPRHAPAVEVLPPAPPPEPPKPAAKAGPPPAHVLALWERVSELKGEKGRSKRPLTRAAFEEAGHSVFGDNPKPSSEWTVEDVAAIEEAINPSDVPF